MDSHFHSPERKPGPASRREWLDVLDRHSDAYLRSPLFLHMLKAQVTALIQARRQAETSPVSLSERLDDVEAALQSRLASIERRLEILERRQPSSDETEGWQRFLGALRTPRPTDQPMRGATPHKVIHTAGTRKLLRYRARSRTEGDLRSSVSQHSLPVPRFAEPVLICYALVNRPYILDLQGDRSVVRQLVERGFDVYLIDWGVPADGDRTLRLEDYVCRFLKEAVDRACGSSGVSRLNLLGYCMGGTMATMFTALFPERVRSLILMATPIDFSGDEGLLNLWSRPEYFDVDQLIDAYGNCPGEFLQSCFQLMKPIQNFAEKYATFCENLDDQAFLENFLAMERWANDSVPVAGETFRQYVKLLYQQNRLVKDELTLGGTPVRLDAITCPVLLLLAEQDHLVPANSTLAIERLVRSSEVKSLSINAGHIGLAVSAKAHRNLWPAATEWIAEHSTAIA